MKDCGGCLGPVVGHQPDLENLQYSISIVSRFLTMFSRKMICNDHLLFDAV